MSKFFIDRPIFAWVIALVLMLAGTLAILNLPVNQYPSIAPPNVSISVSYPGASARTVQDTVVQVIEQQLNGLDGLRYISSESNSDGSMTINVTFEQGTNPDIAQVQVQNKLQLATPLLPQQVQQQGIRVSKSARNFLMVVALVAKDGLPEIAENLYKDIRKRVGASHGDAVARAIRVLYGGSVKPDNAASLFAQADVDGGLIGGASLVAKDFLAIVKAINT